MRPGYAVFILSLITLAVVIAGCSGNGPQSTPTPMLEPTPTTTPGVQGTIHSTQVRMADFKIVQGAGRTGNYTIKLENVASTEARNVNVRLNAKDIRTLELQQDGVYSLDGPIPAYGNRTIAIPTGMYNFETTSVILTIRIYWGEHAEFWNGENMTHILPWAPQPVNVT